MGAGCTWAGRAAIAFELDAARLAHLRRELAAAEPERRAWAAWEASDKLVRELAADVLDALLRVAENSQPEQWNFAALALLDAAIRLDARPNTSQLEALEATPFIRPQLLVLAAREPARHVELLRRFSAAERDECLLAADNLLAAGAPEVAVAQLLPQARVEITVEVVDKLEVRQMPSVALGIGCGSIHVPEGYPPMVLYDLVEGGPPDAIVFADGPRPIAARRTVRSERSVGIGGVSLWVDRAQHALDLLRWIGGDRKAASVLASEVAIRHAWSSRRAYVRDVGEQIRERRQAWAQLVDALVARRALSAERRPAKAPIEIVVQDRRSRPRGALPEFDE